MASQQTPGQQSAGQQSANEQLEGNSSTWLTPHLLEEMDRRNELNPPTRPPPQEPPRDLARFARHGGPDLRYLRRVNDESAPQQQEGEGAQPA